MSEQCSLIARVSLLPSRYLYSGVEILVDAAHSRRPDHTVVVPDFSVWADISMQ